ncbi:MAG TPA: T9SS type A sorting domain-containing protein [Balneolales bacterium]|nr:T9SS type A sorting domain-containing protein [Balneolales bacterium]HYX06529.1 T9SS type A sorting domain-containing protein [Bacteroidales bacterium]
MRIFYCQIEKAWPLILRNREHGLKLAGILLLLLGFHILPVHAQWEQMKMGNENRSGRYLAGTGSHIFAVLVDTTTSKLYISKDDGNTWQPDTTFPQKKFINTVTVADSNLYAVTNSGAFQSADWGKNWKEINGKSYLGIIIRSDTNLILATRNDGVFYSSDEGQTWNPTQGKNGIIPSNPMTTTIGTELINDAGNPVYSDGSHIYHSLDNGKDWTVINDTLNYITVLASNGTDIFAGRYIWPVPLSAPPGGFFRSTDHGKSWKSFESDSLNTFERHGDPVAIHGTKIFAGVRNGLYVSDISKANWKNVGQGLPSGAVESVYTDSSYIFAGVYMKGVWRRPIFQVTAIKKQPVSTIPSDFRLGQNYPNPFNPTTTIRYKIPARAHVRLMIYNVLGQRVKTLVNKEEAPGQYSVQFKALRLDSGVYLYRLRAGNFVQTKKLVLLK